MKPKSSGLAPDVFIKQIENGNIPTVVCIVGEEPYYRDLVRRTLLDAIFTDTPTDSRDISVFEEKTDMKKLDTLINTYPFFSGRTVIFITDKELLNPKAEAEGKKPKTGGKGKAKEKAKETSLSKQEQFQNLLGDVPDFCTVILQAEKMDGRQKFTKFLQKETMFVDCSPVDSRYLPAWLARQAEQRGGRLDRGAVQRIQEYLATVDNPPLQLLAAEVEKIAVYAGDRKNWTAADVDMLFSALPEIGVFALNNAHPDGKRRGAAGAFCQPDCGGIPQGAFPDQHVAEGRNKIYGGPSAERNPGTGHAGGGNQSGRPAVRPPGRDYCHIVRVM